MDGKGERSSSHKDNDDEKMANKISTYQIQLKTKTKEQKTHGINKK